MIRRSSCGTPPPARNCSPSRGIRAGSGQWPSRPTGSVWRPGAMIAQLSCGTTAQDRKFCPRARGKRAKMISEWYVSMDVSKRLLYSHSLASNLLEDGATFAQVRDQLGLAERKCGDGMVGHFPAAQRGGMKREDRLMRSTT